jgi:hypothetical protein
MINLKCDGRGTCDILNGGVVEGIYGLLVLFVPE